MNRLLMLLGPVLAIILYISLAYSGWESAPAATASITFLCAVWWVFEPIPIPFTSTASLLMPLLAAASVAMEVSPVLLMIPAVLSASCAFMLPVATAPNAVIYGSGQVTIKQMARAGFVLNPTGVIVL